MVFGETKPDARQRLMLAFNSPMFPEILISNAVLGEGVDLHRFCRHVIHHDLCWNPSTLEQRTGRLDRIRCKAETTHRPIVVFAPYLGGSADEKMFRVVQDRERWFQIVMGQKFEFDEAASEELANRVSLPESLAQSLVFDLRRFMLKPAANPQEPRL
jgi:superfamily II DNA/RNA helicase